jgi:glycosyltransferase involved in cell wall biosynthesis
VTRPEQGLDLVPNLIGHKSTRHFPKKFIKCFVSEWANIKGNDDVELVRLPYGGDDYHLLFDECDVVLLPYNARSFGDAMSMVFIEAVATCKIPIVSDGTVMARELRRFKLGNLVLDFSNKFSWTLINEIREDIGIRARLNLMAECYSREHDAFAYAEALYQNLKQRNSIRGLIEPKRT